MSDPESGLRSKASPEPLDVGVVETKTMACGPERCSPPAVDNAKVFLEKTLARMKIAVPTRGEVLPTIYKVPKELKRGDKDKGYEPFAVGIGPFAKNNNNTTQLENYKWCCVSQLMGWQWYQEHPDRDGDHPVSDLTARLLRSCLECMKDLEKEIRSSYSEDIEGDSDKLALWMVLDGCFILHRLLKYARLGEREAEGMSEDYDGTQVIGRVCVWNLVASDLLLLENQIPFFVLSKLFEQLWIPSGYPKDALVKGSLGLFRTLCPHMLRSSVTNSETDYHGLHHLAHLIYHSVAGTTPQLSGSDNIKHSSDQTLDYGGVRVHHLLHLFYLSVVGPRPQPRIGESDNSNHSCNHGTEVLVLLLPPWIPCARELEEAGVRFMQRAGSESFLDIEFDSHSGVLKIPPLRLYDFSDKMFRNLIAFEQTYPPTRRDITTYAAFMDCLINTPEDMRILQLRGILVNQINGEQDASRFFSRICARYAVGCWSDKNYLKDVMDKVNNYRGSRMHKWRAALVRSYFSNPWVAMSVLAAVLLLGMTILQTTFTVYPYFNPPN